VPRCNRSAGQLLRVQLGPSSQGFSESDYGGAMLSERQSPRSRERHQRTRVLFSDSLRVSSVRRRRFPIATTSSPEGPEFRRSSTVEERRMSSRIGSDRLICSSAGRDPLPAESRPRRFAIVRFSSASITQNVSRWQVPRRVARERVVDHGVDEHVEQDEGCAARRRDGLRRHD
jgi:hypothetical protein